MAWVLFLRSILTLVLCCHKISTHDENININDLIGQNEVTCGDPANPCKSLDFVWNFILPTLKNSTLVKFSFSPGVYECEKQTLFYDCNDGNITQIGFEAKGYNG